ncbi:MAG: T9SS type A sorting domain-containing protein [Bacteroidetes bacterium]|nr:T9SS type A sorting domain-containing protein [Bacteroidota bacterium]
MKNTFKYKLIVTVSLFAFTFQSKAQIHFTVNPSLDTTRISQLIYGSNGFNDESSANVTMRRLGGNRMTGYNWENNASHAGIDYFNQNDDFMTWANGITGLASDSSGIVVRRFHDKSRVLNSKSLITIQAAGYVSADKSGDSVTVNQAAPSFRFHEVKFEKPTQLTIEPDKNDDFVYMDEQVNYYKSLFGTAENGGISAYAIDNEPGLWNYSHPRIRKEQGTIADILKRTIELATSIKKIDNSALVVGGTCYGFGEFIDFQDAPDKNISLAGLDSYISALLDYTKKASVIAGKQLVDVLDLHWYPEATGRTKSGVDGRICQSDFTDNIDDGIVEARIQAPRSLWDSTYKESSWITKYVEISKPYISLIPKMLKRIAQYNPTMKLGICETDYGGTSHISGGLALVDVLGIYGKYGVFMSMYWGDIRGFTASGYKLFTNYDGKNGKFPELSCFSNTEDIENSSIYSALEPTNKNLHLIVINKNLKQSKEAQIEITDIVNYEVDGIYRLEGNQSSIVKKDNKLITTDGSKIILDLPQLSATHIILKPKQVGNVSENDDKIVMNIYPNPAIDYVSLSYVTTSIQNACFEITDMLGHILIKQNLENTSGNFPIDLHSIPAGVYFLKFNSGNSVRTERLIVTR